ncbi:hypothetical protein BpHYR1_010116 [Brachionus plicatilis]|uniref:Uncharacterized protein n=1 Tax=Brachionus plicatilis TaxID=10195 RepID=A0A3M7PRS0_BRAPC|nr:hypothetical protein BpHYR1_010116 [Brachionus plicatilis]
MKRKKQAGLLESTKFCLNSDTLRKNLEIKKDLFEEFTQDEEQFNDDIISLEVESDINSDKFWLRFHIGVTFGSKNSKPYDKNQKILVLLVSEHILSTEIKLVRHLNIGKTVSASGQQFSRLFISLTLISRGYKLLYLLALFGSQRAGYLLIKLGLSGLQSLQGLFENDKLVYFIIVVNTGRVVLEQGPVVFVIIVKIIQI